MSNGAGRLIDLPVTPITGLKDPISHPLMAEREKLSRVVDLVPATIEFEACIRTHRNSAHSLQIGITSLRDDLPGWYCKVARYA